ncbi:HTH-type transcriptional regulator MurR [Neomoorella glycerini]|uniref:HTH-type transcriptional regulator MurR n=1 Tax=Neomoorella glycerini TaxID=55779 RepID=A0A6I5ZS73_9FIRM|nr:MurR/RpiR family transcriptional regulator [Moorella glycerini]QGP92578.1 HTH-type transcriptional regulator MurR [Moorella glycerini]
MLDVNARIQELFPKLSRGKKKIAEYILNNIEEAAFAPAATIAQKVEMSESVVVRLARDLGFSGYKDMQENIQQSIRKRLWMADQFRQWMASDAENADGYLRVVERDIQNIKDTFKNIPTDTLSMAVDMIIKARRIGIVGLRGPLGPNIIFYVFLNELLGNVTLLTPGIGLSYDILRSWNEQDLVIGSSFLMSKNFTLDILRFAKQRGCKSIAITDKLVSPLAQKADLTLPVCVDGSFTSYTAVVTLFNVLLYLIGKKLQDNALLSLEEIDKLLDEDFKTQYREDD